MQPFKPYWFEGFFIFGAVNLIFVGGEIYKMKKKNYLFISLILIVIFSYTTVWAGDHGNKASKKVGILLVAFGSSIPSAQVSFENIDKKVKATYPGIPVRWAYTSSIIRKKLARQGKYLDSPEVALAHRSGLPIPLAPDPQLHRGCHPG